MNGLQFTGSLLWLLLLVPGLFILARLYRGGQGGPRGASLAALQGTALLLLVVSLAAPEWVRRRAEFHSPAVVLVLDRSASFAGGAYLGLGEAYAALADSLAAAYRAKGFEVRRAEFHEAAWAAEGFPRGRGKAPETPPGAALTSLAAAADFLDSIGVPNLQAVFHFGDGRAVLDSGKAVRSWAAPVYPVVLVPALAEVQLDEAVFGTEGVEGNQGRAGTLGNVEVTWTPVGTPRGKPRLLILRDGRPVFTADLPAGVGEGPRMARLPWIGPGAPPVPGEEGLRAVLTPAADADNQDPYNDTLPLRTSATVAGGHRIVLVKPLKSLDEKAMVDLLHAAGLASVVMAEAAELASLGLTERDQVWTDAGFVSSRPALSTVLKSTPAAVLLYARPGGLPADIAGHRPKSQTFGPGAEVRPTAAAAADFPSGVVRLKAVATAPVSVPVAATVGWRPAAVLAEGGRQGLLMAWFPLAPGKDGLFLALPSSWNLLFDPQADFSARENLDGLYRAAFALAARREGAVRALVPPRAYADIPFDLEYALPAPGAGESGPLDVVARVKSGSGTPSVWPLAGDPPGTFRLEDRTLPRGTFVLELRRRGRALRSDTLEVDAREALELSRIGFDRDALDALAARTGGQVLSPAPGSETGAGPSAVTSKLPNLAGAQIKTERVTATRLHNTRWQFLLAAALLSLSWFLRKRWDLD